MTDLEWQILDHFQTVSKIKSVSLIIQIVLGKKIKKKKEKTHNQMKKPKQNKHIITLEGNWLITIQT